MINDRSCIGCKRWTFDAGHPDWSDVTPGDEWRAYCNERHWLMSGHMVDEYDWSKTMQKAKDCPDYSPRPGAPE